MASASNIPKLSPSPPRRGRSQNSPKRRPLHERSDSQNNRRTSPTIRIVEDSDAEIYSKSPFPSDPSQILSPSRNASGFVFEDRDSGVSDADSTNALSTTPTMPPSEALVPRPLQPRRNRNSTSTTTSEAETAPYAGSPFSSSTRRFSQQSTPPSSPVTHNDERVGTLTVLQEEKESPRHREPRPTIRAVIPSSSTVAHHIPNKPSETSIASSASSDTLTFRKHEDRNASRTSISSVSHPKRPLSGSSRISKPASSTRTPRERAVTLRSSSESLPYSIYSHGSGERPRSSSSPATPSTHVARQINYERGVRLQYPIVKPPPASQSFAESRPLPKNPSRMPRAPQWSSALSTIQSESEHGSQTLTSISGNSAELLRSEPLSSPPASPTGFRHSPPAGIPSDSSGSSIAVPRPLFSPRPQHQQERESDEHQDTLAELRSPSPLRQQRSGYLQRYNSVDSRPSSANSDRSYLSNVIPAWARVYYRRGERTSLGAPDSSTEASDSRLNTAQSGPSMSPVEGNFPLSIFRPRNRPRDGEVRDSLAISEAPVEHDLYVIGPPRSAVSASETFTPRLQPNRRSNARYSFWRAPSVGDSVTFESLIFSRGNRQILMFALGFILPITWIIASFLPLPPKPGQHGISEKATPSQMNVERDMERQLGMQFSYLDEKRYRKAQWWRALNRAMSVVGTMLIGTIIALGIVASKTSS